MEQFSALMAAISTFIIDAADNPFVYLLVFLCCAIDGFFPPIPSESVVVSLASLIMSHGVPNPWLLGGVAALGAFVGDNVAYVIGRSIGTDRFAWMRRPRLQRGFEWAGVELRKRPVSLILVARFVPIGRVAVNLVAGATKYPHRRFAFLTSCSALAWAVYSVMVGIVAGSWFKEHHLLGMVVAIAVAMVLGLGIDRVVTYFSGAVSLRRKTDVHDETTPTA
ncbi:DedA family protein [Paeniglutamicibacter cryotolerans]|uniref:Membrane protein DedA with SNARE-associated domain n=2 Tax=Paeniglutamicibacter cryotolerans TaxID=670079 RepID=A0A839QPN8_9MICC|nr:membrane protein DedA with SNARE-associated domain [Paeniglutamicibacter cryotolerans]